MHRREVWTTNISGDSNPVVKAHPWRKSRMRGMSIDDPNEHPREGLVPLSGTTIHTPSNASNEFTRPIVMQVKAPPQHYFAAQRESTTRIEFSRSTNSAYCISAVVSSGALVSTCQSAWSALRSDSGSGYKDSLRHKGSRQH